MRDHLTSLIMKGVFQCLLEKMHKGTNCWEVVLFKMKGFAFYNGVAWITTLPITVKQVSS